MAKKNNEDFSEFLDLEKEVLDNNEYSDFLNLEKEVESKKKSQSQSGSSTEESSSGTSATKKEQSSGTTKPLSLEEKKELARKQKLGQLDEKKQESKLALERKQKSTNINWDVDKETEQAFKGVATKEEKMEQAKQEAKSVGESYVPNIEEKARAKEIQEAKPEQDLQRRLNLIPKEDLKSIFEGDNELTMFDGGQRLAEKYKLTEEEVDRAKAKYLDETVKEFKRKDLESSLDLINKYAPAPKDFKDITAYTQNIELLNKAKEMNFEKNKNLSFSLMGLEDNDRKVVDEYSSVMDRLNAYKEKSFMQQKQGADETGKGSMVINPKEVAQFEKDLKESQRLSKEVDKIRGNNNKLFDEFANVINKETGKTVTQESFTSKYENDYMKLKGALTDATYKLNYLEKEARSIRDKERESGRMLSAEQLNRQNAKLSNLDRERNLAKAEVLALSNALFLNEDITKKAIKPDETKIEKTLNVFRDLSEGFSQGIQREVFNTTSTSEKNQARILNEKLKEVGVDLKEVDDKLKPTFSEKLGEGLSVSTVLGAQIAATSFLTAGVGTVVRGAGLLPKVFALYDKGGKFKKIADVVISGVNFELASDQTSFAMGVGEESAQLVFGKIAEKFIPANKLVQAFAKTLIGATGITVEEYAGDLFDNITKTGISQETLDATFGKSKEEGLEKFALTFAMGMMSGGKQGAVLMVGALKESKAKNPKSETVKAMEGVMSEMGVDPDDVIKQLKAEAQTKSDRLYPDGKGGQLSASNMTVEQEIVLREKLKYKPLTEEELDIKRTVQEQEELAPADSPYVTKKEMDDDLKVLKGEDEGTLPETYVGESVRTEEGIVTTVTEKVEEGTQLRVPTEQLVVEEAKPVAETFDRKKAGVIDVWQDPETNELFVINGTKRVATAMEDGVASVDVNFVKANDLQEAYKIGDLKNKLEDTDKTIDAVELVKANPTLKENLDLSKPKEAELYGLANLNESLTEELKSNPNQAGVLSIIGNNVSTEKQSEVYQFAKDNNLGKDEVAQLVKEPNLKEEGLADKVKIKTEQSKTGQSNIDALSKDATQLGMEPETLYDRVLSNSTTVKALTEKYAKGVADGLYSTTEATNRLNAEIKENLDAIKKEAGLDEAKKEVAQLESALTSDKKTSSDILRDIASKIDKLANGINTNPNSSLKVSIAFGLEPVILKAFLKTLSATLKTSATFMEAFNRAVKKLQVNKEFNNKTKQEQADIITKLYNSLTEIKKRAEFKNPITKLQQNAVKRTVENRIKHLYQTSMTSLPTLSSIEKIANKYGIADSKEFAERVYRNLDRLEVSRAKRMENFEGAISDFITKGGGSIKSLYNKLSDLILKDKQQAVTLKNAIISVMNDLNAKGFNLTPSQFNSIITAFNKADLSNLSGVYDLSFQIERVIAKAMDIKVNNDIKDLQSSIRAKYKKLPKTQLEIFKKLTEVNPSHISDGKLKDQLLDSLNDIKQYVNAQGNLSNNISTLESLAEKLEAESEKYITDKLEALAQKSYDEFQKFTNIPMTFDEYMDIVYNPALDVKKEQKALESEKRKEAKRIALEQLTFDNINNLLSIKNTSIAINPNSTTLDIQTFEKFKETLQELLNENMIPNLTDTELKEINQVYTEFINFNSLSKIGTISSRLSGVLKAHQNQNFIKDSFRDFSGFIKKIFAPRPIKFMGSDIQTISLGQLFNRLSSGIRAKEMYALIAGDFNAGINTAKTEFKKFNTEFEKAIKFKVGAKENFNLGAKAYFLTSPKDLDAVDAQLLFERKKEKLARDIEELNRIAKDKGTDTNKSKKSSAEERAEKYQEALNEINKYDTYEEYVQAYESGNLFTETQAKIFELAKNEYEKQKDNLISSNKIYGGDNFVEENFYTSTAYLKSEESENKDDINELASSKAKSKSVKDTKSGTTYAKVDPSTVPSDKILDFNFIDVTQKRVLENYVDIHTRGAVLELDSFLNSKPFVDLFKDMNILSTYNYLKQRIAQWAVNETSFNQALLDTSKTTLEKSLGILQNVKKAKLNTTGQFIKQPTVLAHTAVRFGEDFFIGSKIYTQLLLGGKEGMEMLNDIMLGSDVSNRSPLGDEQITKALGRQKSFDLSDKEFYRWMQKFYAEPLKAVVKPLDNDNLSGKVAGAISVKKAMEVGDFAMVTSDVLSAQLTYITALVNTIKKYNPDAKIFSAEDLLKYKNVKNTIVADMLTAEINNESATSKQGNLMLGKDHKLLANLFFMFQSHAMNVSHAASNSLLDIFDPKAERMDRINGVAALVGYTGAILLFRTVGELVGLGFNQLYDELAKALGYRDPREKEDRPRLQNVLKSDWREEAYNRIALNTFTDAMFSKQPGLIQNFVKGKTNDGFENTYTFLTREKYEGKLPYESSPTEYTGVIEVAGEFLASTYKIFAPPLEKDKDMLEKMKITTLLNKQMKSISKDPIGFAVDLGYSIFNIYGKGEPAKMFQNIQKMREREFMKEKKERVAIPDLLFRSNNKKN